MESSLKRVLNKKYVLDRMLGQAGPFDVSYTGIDIEQNDLPVIIREYFPVMIASRSEDGVFIKPNEQEGSSYDFGLSAFMHEAKLGGSFRHKNIVPYLDAFLENGTAYLVSASIKGRRLDEVVLEEKEPIPLRDLYLTSRRLITSLALSHKKGLIHGRLSPRQILIDADHTLRVMRFHMARTLMATKTGVHGLDADAGYTAPELALGTAPLGTWSDVYGVASTLLAILFRQRLPAAEERLESDSVPDLIIEADAINIASRKVLLRALSLNPEERIRSLDELLSRLDQSLGLAKKAKEISSTAPSPQSKEEPTPARAAPPKDPSAVVEEAHEPSKQATPILPVDAATAETQISEHMVTPASEEAIVEPAVRISIPSVQPLPSAQRDLLPTQDVIAEQRGESSKSKADPFATKEAPKEEPILKSPPPSTVPVVTQRTRVKVRKKVKVPDSKEPVSKRRAGRKSFLPRQLTKLFSSVPVFIWISLLGILSLIGLTFLSGALLTSELDPNYSFSPRVANSAPISDVPVTEHERLLIRGDSLYERAERMLYEGDTIRAGLMLEEAWTLYAYALERNISDPKIQDFSKKLEAFDASLRERNQVNAQEGEPLLTEDAASETSLSPFAVQLVQEGDSLYANESYSLARVKYQIAQEYLPDDPHINSMIEQIDLQQAEQEQQNQFELLTKESEALVSQGNYTEARAILEQALEINPEDISLRTQLEVIISLEEEAQNKSDDLASLIESADREFSAGNLEQAREQYNKALALSPENIFVSARIEEVDSILDAHGAVLDGAAQEAYFLATTADSMYAQGQLEEALNLYRRALSLQTDSSRYQTQIQLIESNLAAKQAVNVDENGIFLITDTPPQLLQEFRSQLSINYPRQARRRNIEGRVILRMVVDREGGVSEISVIDGIGYGCDEEALRVMKNARFEPARVNGEPVDAWHNYSILFRLAS